MMELPRDFWGVFNFIYIVSEKLEGDKILYFPPDNFIGGKL